MKILIAAGTSDKLKTLKDYCIQQGYGVVTAGSGLEVIKKYSDTSPDLVLMDAEMPVMGGDEATPRIKALSGKKWTPVLLMTAQTSNGTCQIQGVWAGADDYLTKPVNLVLLGEKIKVMQRMIQMQHSLDCKLNELENYEEKTKEELVLARHVMERIVRKIDIDETLLKRWILPAEDFSADVIAAAATTGNRLHVILADGTGHGLAAALCVMPVTETFYAMTGRGFPITSIVQELNRKIKHLTPIERFVAATIVSIDWSERTIEVWNGGGPATRFISEGGRLLHSWESKHLPLGILGDDQIDTKTEIYRWNEAGQLFLFSDGLSDVRDESGRMFGEERVLKILSETPTKKRFEQLKSAVMTYLGRKAGEDDISLMSIECPLYLERSILGKIGPEHSKSFAPGHWKIDVSLDADEVKKENILPVLLTWLRQIGVSEKHSQRLFLILSELYNNAVDHGLLKLDSSLKTMSEGFEAYLEERSRRLSALDTGAVDIHIERISGACGDRLSLTIKDSGEGFDFLKVLKQDPGDIIGLSGRGLGLVKGLTKEVIYKNAGNEVQVVYELQSSAVGAV